MYAVGRAYNPEGTAADHWTLEIHNIQGNDRLSHWACIMVYASTLDLCLLKAKIICDTLNMDETTLQIDQVDTLTEMRERQKRKNNAKQ